MSNTTIDNQVRKFEWMLNGCCLVFALIILGLFLGILTRPLISSSIKYRSDSRELKLFLNDRFKIEKEHDELISKFMQFDQRREGIMARIPDNPQESVFLSQISQAAKNCGLSVQEFRPSTAKRNERFSEMEIELSSFGNYDSLCRFLELIDELPRYTLVSDISLDTGGSDESFPVQMKLRIFFNEADKKVAWQPESLTGERR